jgi:4-hydroxythreonine-4-phosphate dehydrogenase
VGDPAGIGPEIALAALRDGAVRAQMRLVVIGPRGLRPAEVQRVERAELLEQAAVAARQPGTATLRDPRAERQTASSRVADHLWLETSAEEPWEMGRVQASAGRAALAALRTGHDLAFEQRVSALVTGPVSKSAMNLAGEHVEGQTELLGRWSGVARFEMMAVAGRLRVMLLTRHLPLRRALDQITTARVLDRLKLFDQSLKRLGLDEPSLALAGLNPHAGEGGLLGSEEDEILRPAIEEARRAGIRVAGPISPDSVFEQASRGEYDGVLALYHDQAFIPIKLLARDGGVTIIAGLPYLRVSPVHGTAFEIAGRGIASPAPLISALRQAADWSRHLRSLA